MYTSAASRLAGIAMRSWNVVSANLSSRPSLISTSERRDW